MPRGPTRILRATLAAACLPLLLAACAVGPNYTAPPAVAVGSGYTLPVPPGPADPALAAWWQALGDPTLARLVDTALAQNLTLRQATARIAEAREIVAVYSARSLPALTAGGGIVPFYQSETGPLPAFGDRNKTIYAVGFDATWEVDLFGGVQRGVESAQARAEAAQDDANAVRVSVAAEVARVYLSLRGAQHELAARQAGIETLRRTRAVAARQLAAGEIARADVDAVQARLDAALAGVPALEARIRGNALALGTLLGTLPEAELALATEAPPVPVLVELPAGQRADLLRRRPDIRAAERRLAGSTAEVGASMAEMFPRLSITALGGFVSLSGGSLIGSDSLTGVAAPFISWRLFDGGRVKAEIRAAEARQQTAALAYEGAVVNALGDAERALSEYRHAREALERQATAVASARRDYANVQRRHALGDVGIVAVLDAERQLRASEEALAAARTLAAVDLVALYKSLGGGWDVAMATPPEAAAPLAATAAARPH